MIEALRNDGIIDKVGGRFKLTALIQRRWFTGSSRQLAFWAGIALLGLLGLAAIIWTGAFYVAMNTPQPWSGR